MNYIVSSRSCALQITWMWSWMVTEINDGHLRKGKLKLVKITFISRHFLVKKVVRGGKFFLFDARSQDKFYHYFILCTTTAVCRQIMLAKTIWYLFQSNHGIVVKFKSNKKARGEKVTAGITNVLFEVDLVKCMIYVFQFCRPVTKIKLIMQY